MRAVALMFVAACVLVLSACGPGFSCGPGQQPVCQSGPKYGTQCYCVASPGR